MRTFAAFGVALLLAPSFAGCIQPLDAPGILRDFADALDGESGAARESPDAAGLPPSPDPTGATGAGDATSEPAGVGAAPARPPAPSPPRLLGPADGAVVTSTGQVLLTWQMSPGERYRVILDRRSVPGCVTLTEGSCRATVRPGEHTWAVAATNDGGTTTSPVRSFTLQLPNRPPTPPVLLHPAPGELLQAGPPAFRWTPSTDPDRDPVTYTIHLRRLDTDRSHEAPCDWTRTGTSCGIDLLGGRYAWSVTASDGRLETRSTEAEFEVNRPPEASFWRFHEDLQNMNRLPKGIQASWDLVADPDGDPVTYRFIAIDHADRTETVLCETSGSTCGTVWLRAGRTYDLLVETADDRGGRTREAWRTVETLPPILFLHGWNGNAQTWEPAARDYERAGFEVLRVDGKLLEYGPRDSNDREIQEFAENQVRRDWRTALTSAGYSPNDDVVIAAHSMGGLVARHLIENEGMAPFVDTLVMVGTPNLGSWKSDSLTCWASGAWSRSCRQMEEDSDFYSSVLPPRVPPAPRYFAVAGCCIGGQGDGVVWTKSAAYGDVRHVVVDACHSVGHPSGCKADALTRKRIALEAIFHALQGA